MGSDGRSRAHCRGRLRPSFSQAARPRSAGRSHPRAPPSRGVNAARLHRAKVAPIMLAQQFVEKAMATGWAGDGAVQDQIDATIKDAIKRARSKKPKGPSLKQCEEC